MYKNQVTTWTNDPMLDSIYEELRKKHYEKTSQRLFKNYSSTHLKEVSAKSIYWGHSGEPEIVCSILARPVWPDNTYRILNRLWKTEINTGPVLGIQKAFGLLIQDQINWCELRGAKGMFMSRDVNGAWQNWASRHFTKMTGITFVTPSDKFLTCSNEEDASCWQKIIYCGDTELLVDWNKKVEEKLVVQPKTETATAANTEIKKYIKRLTMDDIDQLKTLVNSKGAVTDVLPDEPSAILKYRGRWLEGMKLHYLKESNTHDMYGYFRDDELISCMAWRCDLPVPWNDGWVVGNLKSKPGYTVRTNGMLQLWEKMFEVCEGRGLKRWHMVIPQTNKNRYQAVADRYFKDVDGTYDYDWSLIVPADTVPDVSWVWGSMGKVKLNTEIRVRTGTKKWEYLVPKITRNGQ
jgi:hypothetical protein